MFGPYYERRDQALVAGVKKGDIDLEQAFYASQLLAGLINRAAVLTAAVDKHESEPGESYVCDMLQVAVTTFLEDVCEARIRGRRARLFAGEGCEHELVNVDFAEGEESLAEIGGALVPE